ncbi:undecaprenyl-diphosphate phosphatase [Candidatus Poribacteria bacterium]|nr:undecaprenyl-diphosphate phosphatase [Candidatus Poribacteria bacterium]MYG07559.1 undecaprenyl-diphosphate phosphatase [Candidatus Poribacteria bacterium]MYK21852.1 undecaprenyl-diphosphate phosphatase [Candidatus Poribacteria bacterium]
MTFLEAILLGILQGLTEFLPISSSGHLVLAQQFLGLKEPLVFFDVMLHVGTLAAVLVVYREAIGKLAIGGVSTLGNSQFWRKPSAGFNASTELKFIWLILLGTIPTGVIAVLFKTELESFFDEVRLVSIMLILTGVILQLPRLRKQGVESSDASTGSLKAWHAPLIGIAQGCAITPGISRSGTTISLALFLGIPAKTAAEYSFLLSIPAILGAVALKIRDVGDTTIPLYIVGAGMLAAFIVGYIALRLLLVVLNRGKFSLFSYYCIALGLVSLLIALIQ